MAKPDIEIKLDLLTLHPERVSAIELADLLRDLEKAVAAEISAEGAEPTHEENSTPQIPILSLVGIRGGSSTYQFVVSSTAKHIAIKLLTGLAKGGEEWASISPDAQKTTHRAISRFVNQNIPVVIKSSMDNVPTVTYSKDRPPPEINSKLYIQGETSLSVEVFRTGGKKPKGSVYLIGEGYWVPINGSKPVIKQLGSDLYDKAIISGIATWRLKDLKVIAFNVKSVESYPREDIVDTLKNAVDVAEKQKEVTHSISKFLEEFRNDDEDDE